MSGQYCSHEREVSTKPRHGVGLNELLGAEEPEKNNAAARLPKHRSRRNRARPQHFPPMCRSDSCNTRLRTNTFRTVDATHAMHERALHLTEEERADEQSEERYQPKPVNHRCEQQTTQSLFGA